MGYQQAIAAQIVAQEADYVLAVKTNQRILYKKIAYAFVIAEAVDYQDIICSRHAVKEEGHSRKGLRCYTALPSKCLKHLPSGWLGMQSIIQVDNRSETNAIISAHFLSMQRR